MMNDYYITPNSRLLRQINSSSKLHNDEKYILSIYQFWLNETLPGLIQRLESKDSEIQKFKFIFLANIHMEYFNNLVANDQIRQFFIEILGSPPWDISVFDKWWIIEVMDLEYSLSDVKDSLSIVHLNAVKLPRGINVSWLEKLKQKFQ